MLRGRLRDCLMPDGERERTSRTLRVCSLKKRCSQLRDPLLPILVVSALRRRICRRGAAVPRVVRGRVTDQTGAPVRARRRCGPHGATPASRARPRPIRLGGSRWPSSRSASTASTSPRQGFATYTRQAQLAVGQDLWLDVPLAVAIRQDVDVVGAVRPRGSRLGGAGHADRPAAGRRAAARRPQLPRARVAGAWHRRRRPRVRRARCAATSPSASTAGVKT